MSTVSKRGRGPTLGDVATYQQVEKKTEATRPMIARDRHRRGPGGLPDADRLRDDVGSEDRWRLLVVQAFPRKAIVDWVSSKRWRGEWNARHRAPAGKEFLMERSGDWMDQARSDLDHARHDLEAEFYEWACFSV